jgi:AsmA-like C-terminal region/AsmA family
MKRSTRIWGVVAGVFVLALAVLAVLPLLFHDRIEQRVKAEVNRSVAARVDWRHAGLSFFRHFPNLTLTLDELTTVGVGRFATDTLAAVRHVDAVVDVTTVLRNLLSSSPVVVRAIELNQPRLSLIKLPDGTANWDITKKTDTTKAQPPGKTMAVSLKRFEISDGAVALDNQQARLKAVLSGYSQSLSGDFSRKNVAIQTRAAADTVSVSFGGVPYLNRVKLSLTSDAQADLAAKSYTLKGTELRLNDLRLDVAGSARSAGKELGLDLAFQAPSTNFRSILSLVPAIYAHDFARIKTRGTFAFTGRIKGEYGDSAFPAFALNAKVNDAAFQYPDLPLPARSIFLDLSLSNPGGSADRTVANLDRFHLLLGSNPVDASAVLRTPLSDPDVNLRVKGKVDLADVRQTLKLDGIDQLTGTIAADAAVRARMSSVDRKQYDKVAASGSMDVAGLTVRGQALPHPLAIRQASLRLAPQRAELTSFTGSVGSSDLEAKGTLDNLIAYAFRDDTLQGTATLRSRRFNLDEWRSGKGDLQIIPVPPKIDCTLNATIDTLTYDKLTMANARGELRIKDQRVVLEDFRVNTLGGAIAVSGSYDTKIPTKPAFDVGLKMVKLNIPAAFQTFATVQKLAPVAKYASGQFTTDLHLSGDLGKDMMPIFSGLSGKGTLQTSNVALHDFPGMNKIVDVTKLQILDNPTMQAIRTAFQIKDGRLLLQPFDVKLGAVTMSVAGSNGIDQSLEYRLGLKVPRSALGAGANQAIASLASKTGPAGLNLSAAPEIPLGIQLTGTVTNPTVKADIGNLTSEVTQGVQQAAKQVVTQKIDSAALRALQTAEQQAAHIRQQAQALADKVKAEGYRQADSLTEKAGGNPLLQAAAKPAADELRRQSDNKATDILREAGQRADSLVSAARHQVSDTAQ